MTTANDLPLAGLKVLELHAIGPVPYAGSLLISLGAQIVRVSPPADPKLGVAMKPEFDVLNAGKTQLLLDMKSAEGMGVLLVEQHVALALSVAHRAYLLQRGRVVRSGPAEELAANLDELEAGYFGEGPAPSSAST